MQLGLCSDFGVLRIYCNRSHGCNWYTLDEARNPVPILEKGLRGYLRELRFEEYERRQKKTWKLIAVVQADRTYLLESGFDTQFSKGLLAAIATLSPQELVKPLVIAPEPGKDDSVLFCRVYVDGQRIRLEHNENIDWRAVAKQAIANVKEAQDIGSQIATLMS